ncbi:YchJ family protein [Methylomonas sp. AM2-LC]|uniref:YchJ family protein n=1 Tax=Methylomonas sp. AM2-LC TaxID=3153301 RepID=UPI003267A07D
MLTLTSENMLCLCGTGLNYSQCCAPYHRGEALAPTAEALMRSRFSAYTRRDGEYLLASWVVAKRPAKIDFSKETAEWQSLQIVSCKKGGQGDTKGIVEFKAFYLQDAEACYLHEISRFEKLAGRWLYVDGLIKAAGKLNAHIDTGRNAMCGCGSGKKFKRCCGA